MTIHIAQSDVEAINVAFGHDYDLCVRILAAAKEQNRDQIQLLVDMAKYTSKHMTSPIVYPDPSQSKKRKLDNDASISAPKTESPSSPHGLTTVYTAPDTSFAVPQRKKMTLSLAVDPQNAANGSIIVQHSPSGVNHTIPFTSITHAFCLPVPEKAQRQWNFVIFSTSSSPETSQLVFTMPEASPTTITTTPDHAPLDNDTYVTSYLRSLSTCLRPLHKSVVLPSPSNFSSAVPQSHRKGEPAHHIKAHRGSKDGFLFPLPTGLLWAFKKPLAFFAFDDIESVAYTSVLQRTFNIVITTHDEGAEDGAKGEEVEFSMLDQVDFAGMDAWIKAHGLNDASMAAERRAKRVNVNGKVKTEDGDGGADGQGVDGEEEETELEKAQREMEDREDEEEEDYDPGSEGESEGEGSSSEEEAEEGGDGGGDDEEIDEVDGEAVEDEE